ncbi:MAG: rod shape-determining protein RodA [Planctomycetes bacterium]|nr:rod shape-determining protein RodA [Planctomycetota bacterium]MCB9908712.1 rod shape-determining protein RodA [Planctomycetota bacterium]HPF14076.1 FtsW/RodA/SpoVE family cell cycle protein [Planctomycetota bacterium]HRV80464.1 FtsW/RodA/SpoVE family cell cycle protein [Planctomycetota bacterium]
MSAYHDRSRRESWFSTAHIRWFAVDWHILILALILLATGMLFLSAMDNAEEAHLRVAGGVNYHGHQERVLLTLPLILVGMLLRPGWVRRHAGLAYAGSIALLFAVMFLGNERNNARRWIQLPRFDLQPSELAKLGLILMLARLLATNRLERPRDWLAPMLVAGLPMLLVAGQPDLGTAMTMVPITLGMLYLAGARGTWIAALLLGGVLFGATARQMGLVQDYQWKRVETWASSFEPADLISLKNGSGYHQYQARLTIGNGDLFGRGLGEGVANGAGHLPERDSDSIFAVIAEESGFWGATLLLTLYSALVLFLMASAAGLRDRFSRLVVGGVAIYFGAHVFIHAAVNIGLLPMTGLTLPLISAGGSSLLTTFLALGLALGLGSHHERSLDQDAFREY